MGEKQVEIDTSFQPNNKCGNDDDDRISHLSDDILVGILSLLSPKEAGRTSVLSPRWVNLWKHFASLDFDAESDLDEISKQPRMREIITSLGGKFVNRINSVIQSHKSLTIKEFRIRFPLNTSHSDSITRWLEFALSRQVENLELDFRIYHNLYERYCFPEELFAQRSSMLLDFKSLKSLSFKNVNVSGGAIEFFLRNCPLLEQLIVHSSRKLSKLEVCGSSLVLKHLELVNCLFLESLKISAPTLTSLRVTRLKGVSLENVPMLVDVSVTCQDNGIALRRLYSVLSCCISQLEALCLVLVKSHSRQQRDELRNFPEMPKLKKLVVEYGSCDNESLIRFATFTSAAPYLEDFVFKNKWFEGWRKRDRVDAAAPVAVNVRFHNENLRVFKFCGYYGRPSDDALVRCILENCLLLEKIVIDPSVEFGRDRLKEEEIGRKNAKQQIEPQLPHHVQLVIL